MDELITARRDLKESRGKVDPSTALPVFLSSVGALVPDRGADHAVSFLLSGTSND